MHELSLLADLLKKIDDVVKQNNAQRAKLVKVRLGALAHISADHFREHFIDATRGTPSENTRLDIEVSEDIDDPHAQDIMLISLEVEG